MSIYITPSLDFSLDTLHVLKAGDTMTGPLKGFLYEDTKDNILSANVTDKTLAYSTDTKEFFLSLGSSTWYKLPFAFLSDLSAPDLGSTQESSRLGLAADYITDKQISNCWIGSNANTTEGSIRISGGTFQIYLNGSWNTVVAGFRFREDANGNYVLEHQPIGFTEYIELDSGNSTSLGLNGLPIIQQYSVSMGAYPVPLTVSGGSF